MHFKEFVAKPLLAAAGIAVPPGRPATSRDQAFEVAATLGPALVKAQLIQGSRGQAGAILEAPTPRDAGTAAAGLLGRSFNGERVDEVLVEAKIPVARELYAAIITHPESRGPLLLFSTRGGMAIEQITARHPETMAHLPIDIRDGIDDELLAHIFQALDLAPASDALVELFLKLYDAFRVNDAELIEINPLVITDDGRVVALDCKLTIDDSAAPRQEEIMLLGTTDRQTGLEAKAAEAGLKYIELGGSVGVLANGAGLTMTTMDVIAHYGGRPSNFLEIGGEAYTKAKLALSILLENPNIKSLLVNFCGAFARTDVMAEGVVNAWLELKPEIPVFFTIHGTGEDEAVAIVRERLGIEPYDLMDDAVKAAVAAANEGAKA